MANSVPLPFKGLRVGLGFKNFVLKAAVIGLTVEPLLKYSKVKWLKCTGHYRSPIV